MANLRLWLALPALGLCLITLGCSAVTVDVTIPVSVSDLAAGVDHTAVGYLQGYVYTPSDRSVRQGSPAPVITQSPTPPTGYQVPDTAVTVSVPSVSGATTRPDIAGFFFFRTFPASALPMNVQVEFPSGGYPSFTTEVPIVPRDVAGFAIQRVDLDDTQSYHNNAGDIRGMRTCRMNFTAAATEAGTLRLYAADRGDLAPADLTSGEQGHVLVDWSMLAGRTRTVTDQVPFDEDGLLELATPSTGNRMLHLYLITSAADGSGEAITASVTGLTLNFRARVSAPL